MNPGMTDQVDRNTQLIPALTGVRQAPGHTTRSLDSFIRSC